LSVLCDPADDAAADGQAAVFEQVAAQAVKPGQLQVIGLSAVARLFIAPHHARWQEDEAAM